VWASFSLHALNYETPPSYHDFPHSRHLLLSIRKPDNLSYPVAIEGCSISELREYKKCDWCGGKYDRVFGPPTRKSSRYDFCSYECSLAHDYYTTLLVALGASFGGFLLLVGYFTIPYISQNFEEALIIALFGVAIGLPFLWCAKNSRNTRKSVPRDSRKGRRVDEPLEYHDY